METLRGDRPNDSHSAGGTVPDQSSDNLSEAISLPVAYVVDDSDTVATALETAAPGPIRLRGGRSGTIEALEEIPRGHKISLVECTVGDPIRKYGIVIARATASIAAGAWVHLHCAESRYDERSSALDPTTGAPTDTRYE